MPAESSIASLGSAVAASRLFEGVAPEVIEAAARTVRGIFFPAGEVIFRADEAGDCLYLVLAGSVRISITGREGREETLASLGVGEFFGEMALIDLAPRAATATAQEACLLGALDAAALHRAVAAAPGLAMNLIRAVTARLRHSNAHFQEEILRAERLSLIGRMASSIIHDFKNPMATILMACQLIERKAPEDGVARLTASVDKAVRQMIGMTQELLEFSRGAPELHPKPAPVDSLLQELDEQILARLPERGVQVEREVRYHGPVTVDAPRFLRCLVNLVRNAQEAMPRGGILRLGVWPAAGGWLAWEVADNGEGMPPEVLARVFEPFVTHGKSGGTGLGTTIARGIAEAHGGSLSIQSEPGRGTVCLVLLPLGEAE